MANLEKWRITLASNLRIYTAVASNIDARIINKANGRNSYGK
jgi:hypothetical protein